MDYENPETDQVLLDDPFWNELVNGGDDRDTMSQSDGTGASLSYVTSREPDPYMGSIFPDPDATDGDQLFGLTSRWEQDMLMNSAPSPSEASTSQGVKRENADKSRSGNGAPTSVKRVKKYDPGFSRADLDLQEIIGALSDVCEELNQTEASLTQAPLIETLQEQVVRLRDFSQGTRTEYRPKSTAGQTKPATVLLGANDGRACTTCTTLGLACMSSPDYLARWKETSIIDGTTTYVLQQKDDDRRGRTAPSACQTCRTRKAKCRIVVHDGIGGTELTQSTTA